MGADTLLVILIVVLIIVIMVRGPKTLPQIGSMLGRGVKETRKEVSEFQKERDGTTDQPPTTPTDPDHPHDPHDPDHADAPVGLTPAGRGAIRAPGARA